LLAIGEVIKLIPQLAIYSLSLWIKKIFVT
jgi:hypothetical protein